MMTLPKKSLLGVLALLSLTVGCATAADGEGAGGVDTVSSGKIIGTNDLTPVVQDGANVPEKYRPLVDAFGVITTMGCTATHIGNGLAITAGHCFNAPNVRKNNFACNATIQWGVRRDKAAYLTTHCTLVLAAEQSSARDYAIFKMDGVPSVSAKLDFAARPADATLLTIFSHPHRRPLEWSKTCPLKVGGWGIDQFSHQCDTEPGSSGATILDDTSLKVIGIHDGGVSTVNYATYLANTPIAELVPAAEPTPPTTTEPPTATEMTEPTDPPPDPTIAVPASTDP